MASDSVADSIQPGLVVSGRYRVERKLGEGGMGAVLLVQHVHTDEKFALKVLHSTVISDSSALERFRREARTPARIDSDHIVRVTDADVSPELGGAPFLVMEYLRGRDLEQRIEQDGAIDPAETVRILLQVARALDKAHGLGIVHRDLKPENLFLTTREDGTPLVKILDFGIAKFTSSSGEELVKSAATSPGSIFGTPLYMSPEQAKGESDRICPQTDVWALGLIAHKMLTGEDLWTAQTLAHLIAQIAYEPIPAPSSRGADFGKDYDAWLLQCCSRDPEGRFASAGEAVRSLAAALDVDLRSLRAPIHDTIPADSRNLERVADALTDPAISTRDRGFTKTDTQLATADGRRRAERSSLVPVIAGAAALAGVIALVALRPWSSSEADHGPDARPATGADTLAGSQPATSAPGAEGPLPEVSPAPSGAEAVDPHEVPSASAVPAASSAPVVAPAPPPPPPGTVKPPPPPPPPSITPPPPPPPVDPLSGRH